MENESNTSDALMIEWRKRLESAETNIASAMNTIDEKQEIDKTVDLDL